MYVLFAISACSILSSSQTEPLEPTASNLAEPISAVEADEFDALPVERKQARIWARLEEIQQEQSRQKSRISLLEKGLLLGVVPDELRNADDLEYERRQKAKLQASVSKKSDSATPKPEPTLPSPPMNAPPEKSNDRGQYEKDLAEAQDHFREGKYGRALVSFEAIGAKYPEEMTSGTHKYWVGLCWFNLKDYDAAQKSLNELVAKNSNSPWTPRAKLYIARIQIRNGLKEQGLQSLRKIIQDFGNDDAAEMARADIEGLKKDL